MKIECTDHLSFIVNFKDACEADVPFRRALFFEASTTEVNDAVLHVAVRLSAWFPELCFLSAEVVCGIDNIAAGGHRTGTDTADMLYTLLKKEISADKNLRILPGVLIP